jgi:hypothetical protein
VTAVIPDEDPMQEPRMCFFAGHGDVDIPYEVIRWFIGQVEEQISASRAWMQLRPELVEVIYRLRQEYSGYIDDDDFPRVLAEVCTTVPETDLAVVLAAAFGRQLGGTPGDKA